jgi:predicted P-loop ATPase
VTDALTFEEWKEEIDLLAEQSPYKRKKSKLSRNFDLINQSWGDYLRYNTLKKTVELKGRELLADKVRLVAARELDVDITATDVHTIVHTIAESNSYSPVVDYLNEVESKFPEIDPTFLDGLAQEYFGTSDPIHSTYFKKFLVAAVARARKPGEKVDHVFMLASQKQGLYKSTFFRILFGDDWFSDQLGGDISDKDEKMKMHLFWCLEWSEFESVYKRKDVATLKNFITSVEDTFRCPYDRQPLSYKRPCVFVGTTNEQEILHDPTGDRRFWIITVNKKIPIFQVIKDKDKIWAAANALHKSGFSWQLTDIEEEQREILNRDYHSVDPWLEVIEEFLTPGQKFVSTQSLYKVLDINPSDRDTYDARRISNVMRRLGWTQGRQKIDNRWKRGWVCTNNEFEFFASETDFTGSTGSTSETLATQASLFDPVKKPLLDLTGSTGSTLTHVSEDTILKSDPGDPVRSSKFFLLDQPEDAQSKGDPVDPVKPASEAKNQKFIESDRPLPAPREVIVEGRFGKSKCIITPLKVIKKRGVDCVFNWTFADGRTGEAKKVRITAGPPEADELAKRIINEWEQEQVKLQQAAEARELQQMLEDESRRYSVRQLGEDNYEWVKDCSLVEVPSYPVNTYFVFQTPDHKIIRVGDRSEFIQEGENEL